MKQPHRIIRTNGQRIAWTNTSPLPDREVVAGIKLVAEHVNLHATVVHVKRMGRRRSLGVAYEYVPWEANLKGLKAREWRHLIVVTEVRFLEVLAHEAKHVEQFKEDKPRSERACDAFAAWVVAGQTNGLR